MKLLKVGNKSCIEFDRVIGLTKLPGNGLEIHTLDNVPHAFNFETEGERDSAFDKAVIDLEDKCTIYKDTIDQYAHETLEKIVDRSPEDRLEVLTSQFKSFSNLFLA